MTEEDVQTMSKYFLNQTLATILYFLIIYFLLIFKDLNFLTLSEKYESLPIECLSMKECAYIIN